MRSVCRAALRLPGLRAGAVCLPGGVALARPTGWCGLFVGGAALARPTGWCYLFAGRRCACPAYGLVRSVCRAALCLPGLRAGAVCLPGGAALAGHTGWCDLFAGGAALARPTGWRGLFAGRRCACPAYGLVRSVCRAALRLPGLGAGAVCLPGGAALARPTGWCGLFAGGAALARSTGWCGLFAGRRCACPAYGLVRVL